jgi:hypothetical protein
MRQFSKTLHLKLPQFDSPAFIGVLCKDFPAHSEGIHRGIREQLHSFLTLAIFRQVVNLMPWLL